MLTKRLRTGYDIYNIQSEHVVYRTYSQQPINSFLPILKVMCGIEPEKPHQFHQRVTQQRRKQYPLASRVCHCRSEAKSTAT